MREYIGIRDAADMLGISTRTLRRRASSGEIKMEKDGSRCLFSYDEINRYKILRYIKQKNLNCTVDELIKFLKDEEENELMKKAKDAREKESIR